jgi:hypothetical protein
VQPDDATRTGPGTVGLYEASGKSDRRDEYRRLLEVQLAATAARRVK